jgi:hypothetical protein
MKNFLPGIPNIESPFFTQLFSEPSLDEQTRRIALNLSTKGYAVLDFPDPDFHSKATDIKSSLRERYDLEGWQNGGHQHGVSLRLQDAWRWNEDVRSIACNQHILSLLSKLYGRRAWPFQTLNFPVGTQQHYHTDSIHFSSSPERFMCGVWVAMEDIDEENGPLVYFPGSHRWPIYSNEHVGLCAAAMSETPTQTLYEEMWRALVESHGAQPEYFHAKKGQALIWAANLMHGGSRQRDPQRTRWSQVTHYYFEDCAYYTPMTSDPFFGSIQFRQLTNIATGEEMSNQYVGHRVPERFVEATNPEMLRWNESLDFDPALYLAANPDVAQAGANPYEHYLRHGHRENRKLRPEL